MRLATIPWRIIRIHMLRKLRCIRKQQNKLKQSMLPKRNKVQVDFTLSLTLNSTKQGSNIY
ncbi:hypothetical protein KGF37_19195, partial [Clostridioides sp. ZZV14-6105]|nr:hypothetical protein [Clostridioides sp. ZZV14-6105]